MRTTEVKTRDFRRGGRKKMLRGNKRGGGKVARASKQHRIPRCFLVAVSVYMGRVLSLLTGYIVPFSLMTLIKRTAMWTRLQIVGTVFSSPPLSFPGDGSLSRMVSIEERRTWCTRSSRSDEVAFFPNNVIPIFVYLLFTFTLFHFILYGQTYLGKSIRKKIC